MTRIRSGSKRRYAVLLALLAVVAIGVAACGGDADEAAPAPAPAAEPPAPAPEPAPAEPADDFSAALLTVGTESDGSWGQSWSDGFKEWSADTGVETSIVAGLNEPDEYLQQGAAFASEGFDFVVLAHGAMSDVALELAAQFPDTIFCQAPLQPDEATLAGEPANVCHLEFEQGNGTFIAGALAAMMTQSGKIGSVNGFAFPALTRQPEGFHLGARCINPDIEFVQQYINSWEDPALAKAAADSFVAEGADIILGATDEAVQGMYESAREAQDAGGTVWIIPEYFDSNDQAPDAILTSVLFQIPEHAKTLLTAAAAGELGQGPGARFLLFDLLGDDKIAPFYEDDANVPANVQAAIRTFEDKVNAGEILVPDESISNPDIAGGATIGAEGDGAGIDVTALGCTDELRAELGVS